MIQRYFPLILGLLTVFVLLLAPPMEEPSILWVQQLQDAAHGPLFALVSAGIVVWLRSAKQAWPVIRQYLLAFMLAVFWGGIGELAQALLTTTRHAEWDDLAIDALGATIGLGLVAFTEPAGRLPSRFRVRLVWPAILLASGAFALPLVELAMNYWHRQQQLPDLLIGDSVGAKDFVRGSEADLSYTSTPNIELPGTRFVLTVVPHPHATWPGIAIEEPWPDWSGYRALEVSITNPNPIELALNIRIEDAHHNQQFTDRFNHPIALSPGQNLKLLISIDQIQQGPVQRELDLQHIARVIVFEKGGPHAHPFIVRHLRLVN